MAFIDLTRSYQRFIGSAVNILDILKEYVEYFNSSCKKIDPTFTYQGGRSVAQVNEFELLEGVSELLLRGKLWKIHSNTTYQVCNRSYDNKISPKY